MQFYESLKQGRIFSQRVKLCGGVAFGINVFLPVLSLSEER
jgi:hypothetical protein